MDHDMFESNKDEPAYSIVRNHTCSNFMGGSALALDEKSRPRQGFCINQFHQRLPFSDIINFHAIMHVFMALFVNSNLHFYYPFWFFVKSRFNILFIWNRQQTD